MEVVWVDLFEGLLFLFSKTGSYVSLISVVSPQDLFLLLLAAKARPAGFSRLSLRILLKLLRTSSYLTLRSGEVREICRYY